MYQLRKRKPVEPIFATHTKRQKRSTATVAETEKMIVVRPKPRVSRLLKAATAVVWTPSTPEKPSKNKARAAASALPAPKPAAAAPQTPEPSNSRSRRAASLSPGTPAVQPVVSTVTRTLHERLTQASMAEALKHLAAADPALAPLIAEHGSPLRSFRDEGSTFNALVQSIVYQQLAGAAAKAIHTRCLTACQCSEGQPVTPEALLGVSLPVLRSCGLSERKASYLVDLAQHYAAGMLSDELLLGLDDDALIQALTRVRGIGRWSVDMFAMFHLRRPDVLPVGDLGVRRGFQVLYKLKDLPDAAQMEQLSEAWRPFRSVGCWYMWRVCEAAPRRTSVKGSKAKAGAKGSKAKLAVAATASVVNEVKVVA